MTYMYLLLDAMMIFFSCIFTSSLNFPLYLDKCLPDLSSSPPGPYSQEMYVFRSEERFKSPPILPPHLLQVILNKDTNISVSILRVLLGHLEVTGTI